MTILGLHVRPEQVIAWADCETLGRDRSGPPVNKLIVNAAGFVAAGCGWGSVADAAGFEAMRAVSLDDLPLTVPGAMRRAAERTANRRTDTADFMGCIFFAAGWSPSLGRCIGYLFEPDAFFAPRFASTFSAPHAPELDSLHPETVQDWRGWCSSSSPPSAEISASPPAVWSPLLL